MVSEKSTTLAKTKPDWRIDIVNPAGAVLYSERGYLHRNHAEYVGNRLLSQVYPECTLKLQEDED